MEAKVSVIIPCYNSVQFIDKAIESVLEQTWKHIEVIIVDDGSSDGSLEVARKYTRKNVIIHQQQNRGACAARNVGYKLSSGNYIQYLDADDLLSPEKIEGQMRFFEKYGNQIVVSCRWDRFYDDPSEARFPKRFLDQDWENPVDWLVYSWEGKGMAANQSWLTPRNLVEKAGGWDERLKINQDGEFFCRVLLHAERIKFCEGAKVYYRSGLLNSVSKGNAEKAESLLLSYQLYEDNILKQHDTPAVRHALLMNYSSFVYLFHDVHPQLCVVAKQHRDRLGFKEFPIYGGENFKHMARLVGYHRALELRSIFRKIKKSFYWV